MRFFSSGSVGGRWGRRPPSKGSPPEKNKVININIRAKIFEHHYPRRNRPENSFNYPPSNSRNFIDHPPRNRAGKLLQLPPPSNSRKIIDYPPLEIGPENFFNYPPRIHGTSSTTPLEISAGTPLFKTLATALNPTIFQIRPSLNSIPRSATVMPIPSLMLAKFFKL